MKYGYTIIYVESVADTLAFYNAAFGLATRFLHDSGTYGELETGETALAFAAHELASDNFPGAYTPAAADRDPLGIEIALVTDDVASAYQRAIDAGASPMKEPCEKPWGQVVAYVRSREGTLIELCTPILPAG